MLIHLAKVSFKMLSSYETNLCAGPPPPQRNIKCSIHSLDLSHLRGSRGQIVATLGLVFDHFGLIYTFFDDIE